MSQLWLLSGAAKIRLGCFCIVRMWAVTKLCDLIKQQITTNLDRDYQSMSIIGLGGTGKTQVTL
jgi:hypothetical protein